MPTKRVLTQEDKDRMLKFSAWLEKKDMTSSEFSALSGADYNTVISWLYRGVRPRRFTRRIMRQNPKLKSCPIFA